MTRDEAISQLGWLKCKTNEASKLEAIDARRTRGRIDG